MMFCAVLYMYISLTMHMHMHACIHNMENVSFNFQTLIFFNCHIWASTKLLCTRVWRTLVGKPNEKNKWLFVYDFPWFSSSRKLDEWNAKLLTFYGLCNRAKGKCAIRSSTHSNVQCGWNTVKCIYCTSIAERQITNAVFSVVMLAQLQSFYSPIQS